VYRKVRLDHLLSRVLEQTSLSRDRRSTHILNPHGGGVLDRQRKVSYHFSVVEAPYPGLVAQLVRALC
jgi:hypothetical protein